MIRRYWISGLKFEQQSVLMELTPARSAEEEPSAPEPDAAAHAMEEAAQIAKIDSDPPPSSDSDHVVKELFESYDKYIPGFKAAMKQFSSLGGGPIRMMGMAAGPTRLAEAHVVFVLSDREYLEAGAPTLLSPVSITLEFQPTLSRR